MFIQSEQMFTAVIAGSFVCLILVAIIVFVVFFHQQQRFLHQGQLNESVQANQLLTTRIEMQEQTLHMVGQELHDSIGQLLSTTKMFLSLSEQKMPAIPACFVTAKETLSKAIKELRSLSKSFNREWLNQFNLFENLQQEVDRLTSAEAITVTMNARLTTLPFDSGIQIMIFRIVQEAIQNIVKHSKATQINIEVAVDEGMLFVIISDNGVGFDFEGKLESGVGLINMRHRTELLKGAIKWKPGINCGTEVRLTIPFS